MLKENATITRVYLANHDYGGKTIRFDKTNASGAIGTGRKTTPEQIQCLLKILNASSLEEVKDASCVFAYHNMYLVAIGTSDETLWCDLSMCDLITARELEQRFQ
ncbi:MAG: hypothetical protein FWC79_02345 [Oscillospiraceae bacterium]|nr:hypothetical protein [Oscillospiraceae bacterium]